MYVRAARTSGKIEDTPYPPMNDASRTERTTETINKTANTRTGVALQQYGSRVLFAQVEGNMPLSGHVQPGEELVMINGERVNGSSKAGLTAAAGKLREASQLTLVVKSAGSAPRQM